LSSRSTSANRIKLSAAGSISEAAHRNSERPFESWYQTAAGPRVGFAAFDEKTMQQGLTRLAEALGKASQVSNS
jgi:hypothetical protein